MIHYYCDGSYKKNIVACGIVRTINEKKTNHFRYTMHPYWFNKLEEFAIYQTLLLIEKKEDYDVTIWNDSSSVIKKINERSHDEFWAKRLENINIKLHQLRKKGYRITIAVKHEKESPHIKYAHRISRMYLDDTSIKRKIKEENQKQKETNQNIKKEINPEKEKMAKEKEIFRNHLYEKSLHKSINTEMLQTSREIYFEKISNKKWCVMNEKNEAIYINENLPHMIYDITKEALQYKQVLHIHQSSKLLFGSAVRKKKTVQKEYPEIFEQVKQWEEDGRIQFVS